MGWTLRLVLAAVHEREVTDGFEVPGRCLAGSKVPKLVRGLHEPVSHTSSTPGPAPFAARALSFYPASPIPQAATLIARSATSTAPDQSTGTSRGSWKARFAWAAAHPAPEPVPTDHSSQASPAPASPARHPASCTSPVRPAPSPPCQRQRPPRDSNRGPSPLELRALGHDESVQNIRSLQAGPPRRPPTQPTQAQASSSLASLSLASSSLNFLSQSSLVMGLLTSRVKSPRHERFDAPTGCRQIPCPDHLWAIPPRCGLPPGNACGRAATRMMLRSHGSPVSSTQRAAQLPTPGHPQSRPIRPPRGCIVAATHRRCPRP